MIRCYWTSWVMLFLCTALAGEEIFSIVPSSGPVSGKVKAVTDTEVIFVEAGGKERSIPFYDLQQRDIWRSRRQLLKSDDAEGLFKLGEFCAQNGMTHDAFKLWDEAGKTNPQKLRGRIEPAWNGLLERMRKSDDFLPPPSQTLDPDALKNLPPRTALRLRVLNAGKPYLTTDEIPWEKRRTLETMHYTIETNTSELTGKYVMVLLEELYKYYALRLNLAPREKLRVLVFATRRDFVQQAAAAGQPVASNVGGFYLQHPSASRCAIYIPWIMQGGDEPTSVLMHECFHQFYHRVFMKGEPTWFNEGMATYFEASIFDGEKITDACINPSRLEDLQQLIREGRVDSLSRLLSMDQRAYQAPQYAEGWGFIYWMAWGKPTKQERTIMQNRLMAFIRSIKGKTPNLTLFEQTTQLKVSDLDDEWKKWALSLNPEDPFGGKGDPRK